MRFHVVTDIHGNWPALKQLWDVLEANDRFATDTTYCIGDVIGYGGWPQQCWEWVAEHTANHDRLRLGNHDVIAARWGEAASFGPDVKVLFSLALHRAILRDNANGYWNSLKEMAGAPHKSLSLEQAHATRQRYQLPIDLETDDYRFLLVHATVSTQNTPDICISDYLYPERNSDDVRRTLALARELYPVKDGQLRVVITGHTHFPLFAYTFKGHDRVYFEDAAYTTTDVDAPFNLAEWKAGLKARHGMGASEVNAVLINPGSVGFPRYGLGTDDFGRVAAHSLHVDTNTHEIRYVVNRYAAAAMGGELFRQPLSAYLTDDDWKDLHANLRGRYGINVPNSPKWLTEDDTEVLQMGLADMGIHTRQDLAQIVALPYDPANAGRIQLVYERLWQYIVRPKIIGMLINPIQSAANASRYVYEYKADGFSQPKH